MAKKTRKAIPLVGNWRALDYRHVSHRDAGWINKYDEPSPVELRESRRAERWREYELARKEKA